MATLVYERVNIGLLEHLLVREVLLPKRHLAQEDHAVLAAVPNSLRLVGIRVGLGARLREVKALAVAKPAARQRGRLQRASTGLEWQGRDGRIG